MGKRLDRIKEYMADNGWAVERNTKKMRMVVSKPGCTKVVISLGSTDPHFEENAIAELRRRDRALQAG